MIRRLRMYFYGPTLRELAPEDITITTGCGVRIRGRKS